MSRGAVVTVATVRGREKVQGQSEPERCPQTEGLKASPAFLPNTHLLEAALLTYFHKLLACQLQAGSLSFRTLTSLPCLCPCAEQTRNNSIHLSHPSTLIAWSCTFAVLHTSRKGTDAGGGRGDGIGLPVPGTVLMRYTSVIPIQSSHHA